MNIRYEIFRPLAPGVQLAKDKTLSRWVVLKKKHGCQEIELAKQPRLGFAMLLDQDPSGALVFEYCPWPKLADYLDRPRLDSQWVIKVLKHLTRAIGRLHTEGLIHGDLHPDNLLVSEQGKVCILDLGSACKIGQPVQHFHPLFGAPEMATKAPASPAMDCYSIAQIAWHLCVKTQGFGKAYRRRLRSGLAFHSNQRTELAALVPSAAPRFGHRWLLALALISSPTLSLDTPMSLREQFRSGAGAQPPLSAVSKPSSHLHSAKFRTTAATQLDPPDR